jgi:type IV pilus assembly protein PilB
VSDRPSGNPQAAPARSLRPQRQKPVAVESLRGRQLGRILINMGKLRRTQVNEALEIQKQRRGPIGKILVQLGYITDEDLTLALAAQSGMASIELAKVDVPAEVIARMTQQMATTYRVVPFDFDPARNELAIALDNPDNFVATDDLRTLLGFNIKPYLCSPGDLQNALDRYYPEGQQESIAGLINELGEDEDLAKFQGRGDSIDLQDLKEMAESNPVKKLLNLVLLQAIKEKASDIHFEPFEDEFKMRYRIDGVLYEMIPPPRYVAMAIASRIKVMANLDIAERRLPQDGRIELSLKGVPIDLRVAVLPTLFGESVVLRVLDRSPSASSCTSRTAS